MRTTPRARDSCLAPPAWIREERSRRIPEHMIPLLSDFRPRPQGSDLRPLVWSSGFSLLRVQCSLKAELHARTSDLRYINRARVETRIEAARAHRLAGNSQLNPIAARGIRSKRVGPQGPRGVCLVAVFLKSHKARFRFETVHQGFGKPSASPRNPGDRETRSPF